MNAEEARQLYINRVNEVKTSKKLNKKYNSIIKNIKNLSSNGIRRLNIYSYCMNDLFREELRLKLKSQGYDAWLDRDYQWMHISW